MSHLHPTRYFDDFDDLAGCRAALDACGPELWERFYHYITQAIGTFDKLRGTPEVELRDTVTEFFASRGAYPSAVLKGQVMRELLAWSLAAGGPVRLEDSDAMRAQVAVDLRALTDQRQELEAALECYAAHIPHVEAAVGQACGEVRGCCQRLRDALDAREGQLIAELQEVIRAEAEHVREAQEAASVIMSEVVEAEAVAKAALSAGSVAQCGSVRRKRVALSAATFAPPAQLPDLKITVCLDEGEQAVAEAIAGLGRFDAHRGRPHVPIALAGAIAAHACRARVGVWVDLCRRSPACCSPRRCRPTLPPEMWDDCGAQAAPPEIQDDCSVADHLLRLIWETNSPSAWSGPRFTSPPRERLDAQDTLTYAGALIVPVTTLQIREDCWCGPRGYELLFEEGGRVLACAEVELVVPPGVRGRVIVVRQAAPVDGASPSSADPDVGDLVAQGTDFIGDGRRWYSSDFDPPVLLQEGDGVMWEADEPGARDCYVHDGEVSVVAGRPPRPVCEGVSVRSRYGRHLGPSTWSVQMRLLLSDAPAPVEIPAEPYDEGAAAEHGDPPEGAEAEALPPPDLHPAEEHEREAYRAAEMGEAERPPDGGAEIE
eukprot:TRINITY_DN64907_c0_g1_i1.p1 TRINITY_DN64907_c0_g1~~TRINITY_DN64907_c0_g1_i1.p1  ORF type:complete len:626 (+),score=180.65 TRINITY_DN64907_c0_g1_i1:74-1879(+)